MSERKPGNPLAHARGYSIDEIEPEAEQRGQAHCSGEPSPCSLSKTLSPPNEPPAPCSSLDSLWIAALLQTSDSFYPTGSYAHSFGLESLVQEGAVRDVEALRRFLLDYVFPALTRTDLPLAAHAFAAAGPPPDWDPLCELCFLGSALRCAREPREAAEAIGRQRLELASRLRGGIATAFRQRAEQGQWPQPAAVVAAIEGRALGAPREAVLAAMVYATASGLVSAAVKLLRLGQNACQTLLAEALGHTSALIDAALGYEINDIGSFNPWWDIAASRHETADFRLFIS